MFHSSTRGWISCPAYHEQEMIDTHAHSIVPGGLLTHLYLQLFFKEDITPQ
jgi:hypothetical protein